MHEEGRTTEARRRYKKIEILIDSGDDEPIGFLLKTQKLRNHKKEFDGESGSSVPDKSKSTAINHDVDDDDPGGMDDTLACFRKRLKIPKKNHTPAALTEHNYLINFTGSSPQDNLDLAVECAFDRRKHSEHTDQNLNVRENKRLKRSKTLENNDTTRESATGSSFFNSAEGMDIDSGIDEDFDDLLSSFVKKTQSQLIRSKQVITSTICSSIPHSPLKKFHRRKRSESIRHPELYLSVADVVIDQGTSFRNDVSDLSNLCEVYVVQDFSPPIDFCEELTPVHVFSGEIVEFHEDTRYRTINDEGVPFPLISNVTISHSPAEITDELNHCLTENPFSTGDSDAATLNSLLESIPIEDEQRLSRIEQPVHFETKKEEKDSVIELDLLLNEEKKSLLFDEMFEEFHKDSVDLLPFYCTNFEQKSLSTIVNHNSDTIDIDVTFKPSLLDIGHDDTEFYTGLPPKYSSSESQLEGPSDRTVEEGMTTAGDSCNNCSTENNLSGSLNANETEIPLPHDDPVEISYSKSDSTIPSTNLCEFVVADMKTSSLVIYEHDKSLMKIGDYNPVEEDTIEYISRTPEQSGYFSENPASNSEPEMKKHAGGKWALRKATKQSHRKADSQGNGFHSDGLVNGFFKDCKASGVEERYNTAGVKLEYCSDAVTVVDHGVAAVTAGLKSRTTTPIEKILFKDVFKRKGGLQEYLEIRNRILGLWSKDISRVLLPIDCGLADIYSENDLSRFSLFRDIYEFLDQRGYINIGIASNKNDTPPLATICMDNDGSSKTDNLSCMGTDLACQNPEFQCQDKKRKRRIIVVGAGPAGLTAAQHLQRQGFSVTVLEGRNRIGGRVFTDRTSLSVPVDLGASIITGVEADIVTERRPDPSSLICGQLGVDLTVLDSDCPLYDTVSGQKVPSGLDEELEAEFNSLLDDTVLLVAHEGERASKMSLEDGLEFVLRRRRRSPELIGCRPLEPEADVLSPLERRVMDWHFAHLEYGCAALLRNVSLPCWNQDDAYGGFGGAHCMVRGGYSSVVESIGKGLDLRLGHTVTGVHHTDREIRVLTSDGVDFSGDAVLLTIPLGCLKAETISFSPPLPEWKTAAVRRLGFGVLNKVALEFPEMFWDESVDYFGATSEGTAERGLCFMFWNVEKTVGAPVLISLVVGRAAVEGEMGMGGHDYVSHAVGVLRRIFGDMSVPDPVRSVVTDWGRDPFSHGSYSYVAVGATGDDYDLLARPVGNRVFFAGEGTCKEHPDTVGGAMLSGIREAVRIADVLMTGKDHMVEVEAMEAAQNLLVNRRSELGDIIKKLDSVVLSTVDGSRAVTREALLEDMFYKAKTTSGRLHLSKELLGLPPESLKGFAGNRKGLSVLNMWILDSMGKDGTQLLRHCVRILVLVSTNLVAVRLSGIGKTVKEKVCVHSSRDIRAVASQLVGVWVEVFRKEKAALKSLRCQASAKDSSKCKPVKDPSVEGNTNPTKTEASPELKSGIDSPPAQGCDFSTYDGISEEEKALVAVEESARAAAVAAAQAYASSEAKYGGSLHQLPKIPSFHKYARREQYAQEETEAWRRGPGTVSARQDCMSEIDSRNCRVRNWSVDFSAACVNPDEGYNPTRVRTVDHQWNDYTWHSANGKEYSSESNAVESSMFTRAWVDTEGSVKDYHSIERWRSQAVAPDEDDSAAGSERRFPPAVKWDRVANESTVSHITTDRNVAGRQFRGSDHMKQAVVDYVASLLMPLYKARKVDKDGYKSIMKKTATKVIEQATDAEKSMPIYNFLDSKRKNKIRDFVDKLLERHLQQHPTAMEPKILNT